MSITSLSPSFSSQKYPEPKSAATHLCSLSHLRRTQAGQPPPPEPSLQAANPTSHPLQPPTNSIKPDVLPKLLRPTLLSLLQPAPTPPPIALHRQPPATLASLPSAATIPLSPCRAQIRCAQPPCCSPPASTSPCRHPKLRPTCRVSPLSRSSSPELVEDSSSSRPSPPRQPQAISSSSPPLHRRRC